LIETKLQPVPHIILVCAIACSLLNCSQRTVQQTNTNQAEVAETFLTTPPFSTKEPDKFQALRTTTYINGANESVTKQRVAKDGTLRRDESGLAGVGTVIYLTNSAGRFVMVPARKIYADVTTENAEREIVSDGETQLDNSPEGLIHTDQPKTQYQQMGTEDVNGRSCTKYRVIVNTTAAGNVTNSENIVWVDNSMGIPIKTVTTARSGAKMITEFSELSSVVDPKLFEIPQGFTKVTPLEVRRSLSLPEVK
jgi:hypothetical protein